jgi:hypothetical protein
MAKKLKRIPSDIASYILINGQAAKDANDKMLAASYGHSKIDLIDWYLAILDSDSKKYIVPHTKEQLLAMKEKIQSAIDTIIDTPLRKQGLISIDYPDGYKG